MTNRSIALLDVVYWPIIQISISAIAVRLPAHLVSTESWITSSRTVERSLHLYRSCGVHRWKKRLPDAAFLVGGARKRVNPYHSADAARFVSDLRRAELAHWAQLAFALPCWLWNPMWAAVVMTLYAIATNVPCIAAQRYNSILMQHTGRQRIR